METIKENKILSPAQKILIQKIPEDIRQSYVLTGGTALTAFYLNHRFSEDLDFFAISVDSDFSQSVLESKLTREGLKIAGRDRIHDRKIFSIEIEDGATVKVEFVPLYFRRLEKPVFVDNYLFVDRLNDIIANKIIALTDRFEIKDFIDVYYIATKYNLSIENMIDVAQKKYDTHYEYLVKLSRINVVQDNAIGLIKTVDIIDVKEFKRFFLDSERLITAKRVSSIKRRL